MTSLPAGSSMALLFLTVPATTMGVPMSISWVVGVVASAKKTMAMAVVATEG